MQIKINILFLCFLLTYLFSSALYGQLALSPNDSLTLTTVPKIIKKNNITTYPDLQKSILLNETPSTSSFSIQKNLVFTNYGFFCKQEALRDKKSVIPVRVRLGSLDAVNRKEYGSGACQ